VKIDTFIPFPLELDITPYIEPELSETYENQYYEDIPHKRYIYSLYGVCNHSGGLNSGHYTAFTRLKLKEGSRGDWHYISDTNWHPVSVDQVLKSPAYILFYEIMDK